MSLAPIAIADIHGRLDLLELAVMRFPDRRFVLLGDYIDRGPQSRAVLQRVRELVADGRAVALLGNHDKMLLDFVVDGRFYEHWMSNGGDATLANYSGEAAALLEDARWMLDHLKPWHTDGAVLFSHAMRPDLSGHDLEAHLWGRPGDTAYPLPAGLGVSVHGHTVQLEGPQRTALPDGTVAWFIDTGAVFFGGLCCLDCETWQATEITAELVLAEVGA